VRQKPAVTFDRLREIALVDAGARRDDPVVVRKPTRKDEKLLDQVVVTSHGKPTFAFDEPWESVIARNGDELVGVVQYAPIRGASWELHIGMLHEGMKHTAARMLTLAVDDIVGRGGNEIVAPVEKTNEKVLQMLRRLEDVTTMPRFAGQDRTFTSKDYEIFRIKLPVNKV